LAPLCRAVPGLCSHVPDRPAVRAPVSRPSMSARTHPSYRRHVLQFIVLFCLLSGASSGLETWMRARGVGQGYQERIAAVVCAVVRPLGVDARRDVDWGGNVILAGSRQLVVTIECAAVLATGLFVSAVLAFPCSWRARIVGVVTGVVGVGLLNLVRIIILTVIAECKGEWFKLTHDVLMQGFLLVMVAPLWLLWLAWVLKPAGPGGKGAGPPASAGPGQAG